MERSGGRGRVPQEAASYRVVFECLGHRIAANATPTDHGGNLHCRESQVGLGAVVGNWYRLDHKRGREWKFHS